MYLLKAVILPIIALIFSALTFQRNIVWKYEMDIWKDAIKKSPYNNRSYNGLGVVYLNNDYVDNAIKELSASIRLAPNFADAHSNLGNALLRIGKFEDAVKEHLLAIQMKPSNPNFHLNLGVA